MRYLLCTYLFLLASGLFAQTLVIAHRGASAWSPENSLEAFQKAIDMHADIIETDVHQTADSVLVLMHDLSVNRTCDIPDSIAARHPEKKLLIRNLTYAEFAALRIHQRQVAPPSLDAAIKLIKGHCKLLIEIKRGSDYYPGIEARILRVIHENQAEDWVSVIHSFDKKALLELNRQHTGITLQKLIVFKLPLSSLTYAKRFSKDDFECWKGVNVYYRFISRRLVRKLHKSGKTVYAWTVNKPRAARRLVKRGVDGIISNKPDMIKKILAGK